MLLDDLHAAKVRDAGSEDAHQHANARLGQPVDLIVLEEVAENERTGERHQSQHEAKLDAVLLLLNLLLGHLLLLRACEGEEHEA